MDPPQLGIPANTEAGHPGDLEGLPRELLYAETAAEVDTFAGVAEATMYRDEGWIFMQLGRVIERSQLLIALLLFQLAAEKEVEGDSDTDWTTLLRAYHAFEAYNRKYSVEVQSGQVLDLLVTDPLIPGSLSRTLDIDGGEYRLPLDPVPTSAPAARPRDWPADWEPSSIATGRTPKIAKNSSNGPESAAARCTVS